MVGLGFRGEGLGLVGWWWSWSVSRTAWVIAGAVGGKVCFLRGGGRGVAQRAQRVVGVVGGGGGFGGVVFAGFWLGLVGRWWCGFAAVAGWDFGGGGGGVVAALEWFLVLVLVLGAPVRWVDGGSVMGARLRVGEARVAFVREREGGCAGGRGLRAGGVEVAAVAVEARLVMRRGRGMRLRSAGVVLAVLVMVVVVGWREGAERLWETEWRRTMGWIFCRVVVL